MPADVLSVATYKPPARPGPEKISVARLPVTGSDVFGREEDIAFLNDAWANQQVNVVTIVAWAGVGKSTLVNHWLRRMAVEHYRSAQLVFGWSILAGRRKILRGWARSASGDTAEGISWIEDGIEDWRAIGTILMVPYFLALKAEALHLADRTSEALATRAEASYAEYRRQKTSALGGQGFRLPLW
jgi:hypothetical protein